MGVRGIQLSGVPNKGIIGNTSVDVEQRPLDGGENPFADPVVTNSVSKKLTEELQEIPTDR